MNIKNIKICPSAKDKSRRTVYVECDHSLEEEVKEKLEDETTQLGVPGTLRVSTEPESEIIEKDEGIFVQYAEFSILVTSLHTDATSKRVREIEEVLKHEPGTLCLLLEMFQEAEVSNTTIDNAGIGDRKDQDPVQFFREG